MQSSKREINIINNFSKKRDKIDGLLLATLIYLVILFISYFGIHSLQKQITDTRKDNPYIQVKNFKKSLLTTSDDLNKVNIMYIPNNINHNFAINKNDYEHIKILKQNSIMFDLLNLNFSKLYKLKDVQLNKPLLLVNKDKNQFSIKNVTDKSDKLIKIKNYNEHKINNLQMIINIIFVAEFVMFVIMIFYWFYSLLKIFVS